MQNDLALHLRRLNERSNPESVTSSILTVVRVRTDSVDLGWEDSGELEATEVKCGAQFAVGDTALVLHTPHGLIALCKIGVTQNA